MTIEGLSGHGCEFIDCLKKRGANAKVRVLGTIVWKSEPLDDEVDGVDFLYCIGRRAVLFKFSKSER